MQWSPHKLPALPEIGYPETFYARRIKQADLEGDIHTREAYKVGQYITLALAIHLEWQDKLRYFRHALRRHCQAPPLPSDELWLFYQNLSGLVRQHAGHEALKLAAKEDEVYASRLRMGGSLDRIRPEAARFFSNLMGSGEACPEHFSQDDWDQLLMLKHQWM